MKTTTRQPDTIDHCLALAWGAGRVIVRDLLIPLLALVITLATLHREPTLPVLPAPQKALPAATAPVMPSLEGHTVAQLRQMARAAGHKQLARTGRRQQLLEVLA